MNAYTSIATSFLFYTLYLQNWKWLHTFIFVLPFLVFTTFRHAFLLIMRFAYCICITQRQFCFVLISTSNNNTVHRQTSLQRLKQVYIRCLRWHEWNEHFSSIRLRITLHTLCISTSLISVVMWERVNRTNIFVTILLQVWVALIVQWWLRCYLVEINVRRYNTICHLLYQLR